MALRNPSQTRVVIVGGGLSGLTAAYELSRTSELRECFEVTVHQMGWRLGGKLASGRNRGMGHRNEEHGLHVWFGFYENAFRLAEEVYERWQRPPGCPIDGLGDVFRPQTFTPIGERTEDGIGVWTAVFGANGSKPGHSAGHHGKGIAGALLGLLVTLTRTYLLGPAPVGSSPAPLSSQGLERPLAPAVDHFLASLAEAARTQLEGRGHAARRRRARIADGLAPISRLIGARAAGQRQSGRLYHLRCCIEFLTSLVRGLLDPGHGLLEDYDLDRINHLEFREWLVQNGLRREVAHGWPGIAALYDSTFQYRDGDRARPAFEAGTAARFFIRAYFTYKGAVLYLLDAGMGEAFIAPLYEVLLAQGVRFEFFSEFVDMKVEDGRCSELSFRRQARPRREPYSPLYTHDGLRCWPSEPHWDQLLSPTPTCDPGLQFESGVAPGEADPAADDLVRLQDGRDYDEVLLAVPAGVLGERTGPSPCEALLDHSPHLRRALDAINLVPSVAAQLWIDRDLGGLGWRWPRPAMVCWARPYDVWADMTPVLAHESWPVPGPSSTHYLCGTFTTRLHLGSPTAERLEQGRARARDALQDQLSNHALGVWPAARLENRPGRFDWSVLHDPKGRSGPARLDAQYIRANIAPTDLCDCASPGTARLRPEPHESGLDNLVLCGTWTNNGVNSSCVEAATMAGLGAARVLAGPAREILGEHFMRRPVPPRFRNTTCAREEVA